MKGRILSKLITRDMPLIAVECWYKGGDDAFYRFFNIEFPANMYLHRDGAFEFYRDTRGFHYDLPKKLSEWIYKKGSKLDKIHEIMTEGLSFFNNYCKDLNDSTVAELLSELDKAIELFTNGFVGVLITHHVPIFHSNFVKNGEKIFDEEVIDKLIKWRESEGNIFFNEGINAIYLLLEKIGRAKRWHTNLLKYITYKELSGCINNDEDLPIEQLHKRKNSVFIYFDYKVIFEPDIKIQLKKVAMELQKEELSKGITQIHGNIANRGIAKGKIKIVFNRRQLNKVKKGDILVTPMTSVWYVPAMKKASAIITDEGGITCHASIISRELGKPCIIGTKIATEVLKDGELVEVDANKGIIKKLE